MKKRFKNLSCSWLGGSGANRVYSDTETHLLLEAPITSRGRRASKRLLMELLSHLGKKLFLLELLDELDMQDPQRNDC